MQVRAKLKNFTMSEKKMRKAVGLLKGKNIQEVRQELSFLGGKTGQTFLKLLDSAIANGVSNQGLNKDNLYVEGIKIDKAQPLKRWRPRAHGRAYPILKRHCHVELILNEVEEGKKRIKVEKKEAKTITYKELKKITEQADKVLEKQQSRRKKEKESADTGTGKKGLRGGAIRKMFRRKSI